MLGENRFFRYVVAIVSVFVGIVLLVPAGDAHAQLSCEEPPFDVQGLQDYFWTKTDFCLFQEGVFDEIVGPLVIPDGIPPIDDPQFDSIETSQTWLEAQSPVIAVTIDGESRAYPLAVLTWHEIVNDIFGDIPVAVTFCPLCNSAIVFDRRVAGEVLRFGVSGMLRNSDLIMWDDQTSSWWQQLTGTGIVGRYTGVQLEVFPSQMVGFEAFAEEFPDGRVLQPIPGLRSYGANPYVGYDTNAEPFAFRGELDDRLFPTERVLAGMIAGAPVAYPFAALAELLVVNDEVGEEQVVAFWQPGAVSALDQNSIDESRDVGMAALYSRMLEDRDLTFHYDAENDQIVDDETGSEWNVFGRAIAGDLRGTQLRQLNAAPHFWFAWAAFQPDTLVYGLENDR